MEMQMQVGIPFISQPSNRINSRGIWLRDDPLSYSIPLLLLQLSLASILTRLLSFLLKRCAQPSFVSQILDLLSLFA
ncbi:unnamed protein product [Citrullus colocynthis]|uniref:Uncharacterized protein n=1 Tax=Citrullus colocynthis TaxID=252529 RepID=A0ABP0Y2F9_9ROSI